MSGLPPQGPPLEPQLARDAAAQGACIDLGEAKAHMSAASGPAQS